MYVKYKKKTKVKTIAKYRFRLFLKYFIVLIIFYLSIVSNGFALGEEADS